MNISSYRSRRSPGRHPGHGTEDPPDHFQQRRLPFPSRMGSDLAAGVFWASQFLPNAIAGYAWMILDILGGILSAVLGIRMGRGVRSSSPRITGKRIAFFWLLLFFYCLAAVTVSWPADGKQTGHVHHPLRHGRLDRHGPAAFLRLDLVRVGNHRPGTGRLLPVARHLLSVDGGPGGGGMIVLGLYIRSRW